MSVTDDGIQSGSDSFWEVGKYMRTVKRVDNGFDLCNHMKKLISERAEIEKKYSAMLSEWAKKWNTFLDKGPEYGTTQGAWRGVLTEADHVADLHTEMAERLMLEVHMAIKHWQKDNYHKSMMHFKETKDFEDNFRKAQKPWAKRLTKVMAAKKEYHAACRTEKSTANQENNARGDTTVSQDQLKKLQDKLRKCQSEVEGTREKYNAAVNDLNGYNAKYIEDMSEVYTRCQEFEQKRIEFFKKTLFQLHACLDLSVESRFSQIYTSLHATIGNVDYNKDLKWWSANYGVDMPMHWPTFEEYSPELQSISRRGKSNLSSSDGGIMITSIKHHSREGSYGSYTNEGSTEPPPPQPPQQISFNSQTSSNSYAAASSGGALSDRDEEVRTEKTGYDSSLNPFGDDDDEDDEEDGAPGQGEEEEEEAPNKSGVSVVVHSDSNSPFKNNLSGSVAISGSRSSDVHRVSSKESIDRPVPMPRTKDVPSSTPEPKEQSGSPVNNGGGDNPFGEHDDGEDVGGEEPPSQGWVVRALYDYIKAEDDELDFKAGDIFTQIATEDEMGWCKGQKDGKVGFYPKNYVERI
ncbi:protein kinase c and casein kinase substrate in neurons protein 1 [Plakobranchus ocellatus]|uniref:Protein kinase c and casein kinase substrate in neurons protein 1 n=1 Tax=Plakobranchus ocellatus TaxID=259542 RepID=A0AAV4CNT5_9GAST|nr:protein kinase c and casein kinase substrate in neurons protein 1 [Plakobranchus ocellatus]